MNDAVVKVDQMLIRRKYDRPGQLPGIGESLIAGALGHAALEREAVLERDILQALLTASGSLTFHELKWELARDHFGKVTQGTYGKAVKQLVKAGRLVREDRPAAALWAKVALGCSRSPACQRRHSAFRRVGRLLPTGPWQRSKPVSRPEPNAPVAAERRDHAAPADDRLNRSAVDSIAPAQPKVEEPEPQNVLGRPRRCETRRANGEREALGGVRFEVEQCLGRKLTSTRVPRLCPRACIGRRMRYPAPRKEARMERFFRRAAMVAALIVIATMPDTAPSGDTTSRSKVPA